MGPQEIVREEAERLWQLHHPNVVRPYAYLDSQELTEKGQPAGFLVLDRLGPSLRTIMDSGEEYVPA